MRRLIPFLFALPVLAGGGGIVVEPPAACTVSAPWGQHYTSGTLVCFKGDPRAPYAVFDPTGPDGTGTGSMTASRLGDVWLVTFLGPGGEVLSYITVPAADCIQLVSGTC